MIDVRVVAVTSDRTSLVLEDDASTQYLLPIDRRLATALRPDRARPAQLEITLDSQLTPREMQARIRAGHSVEEVAVAAGVPAERVERYAAPVLAERTHVVQQAQATACRRAPGGHAPDLFDLVETRLREQGLPPGAAGWDAWRGQDDRWLVRVSYREPAGSPGGTEASAAGQAHVATWLFDVRARVLTPADDEARWLLDESGTERPGNQAPGPMRRLSSVPAEMTEDADRHEPGADDAVEASRSGSDTVYDREADEARETVDVRAPGEAVATAGQQEPGRRAAAGARPGRRRSVPSWDDIMFGPRKHD